jgi:hypothetical protein
MKLKINWWVVDWNMHFYFLIICQTLFKTNFYDHFDKIMSSSELFQYDTEFSLNVSRHYRREALLQTQMKIRELLYFIINVIE